MKQVHKDVRWDKNLIKKEFKDLVFENLTVSSKKIVQCEFNEVNFKHCDLGSRTVYKNCKFIKCKFTGKYASLGSLTDYINCLFYDCSFLGTMIFMGSIFKNCEISGKMKNIILINEKRFLNHPYNYKNCDLTNVEFENITFNGNKFFKNCKLPKSSIRLFRNDNDILIDYAQKKSLDLNNNLTKQSLLILFDKKLRSGFNPFIMDIPLIENSLDESTRVEFERIVEKFEIKTSYINYIMKLNIIHITEKLLKK